MPFCPACGIHVDGDDQFCRKCGRPLRRLAVAAPPDAEEGTPVEVARPAGIKPSRRPDRPATKASDDNDGCVGCGCVTVTLILIAALVVFGVRSCTAPNDSSPAAVQR